MMDYTFVQLKPPDVGPLRHLLGVFGEAFEDMATYQDAVRRTTICNHSSPLLTSSSSSRATVAG